MIRITTGVYGGRDGIKTAKDAPFSLSDAEEARLVNRGVAEYVFDHAPANDGGGVKLPGYDIGMTEKQLRGLAAYYGVDVSKIKGKKNIVAALDEHFKEQEPEDPEDPAQGGDPDDPGGDPGDPANDGSGGEPEDPDAPKLGAEEPEA